MYYEPPYGTPQPISRLPNRRAFGQMNFRWISFCFFGICSLLIIAAIITFTVIYFVRNQDRFSSILSYPDFVCSQRPCGCPLSYGRQPILQRIVGGKEAAPYFYPWLVGLTNRDRVEPFCSGFIISPNTILTAAHCVFGRYPIDIQILSKLHDIRQFYGDRHDIETWFIYPEYRSNDSRHLNDIAIIRVRTPFAPDLQPCCLPTSQSSLYPQAAITAVVGGWGKVASQGNNRNSAVLQHLVLPIVDSRNSKCRQTIIDSDRQLCAGYDRLPVDTCSGDSGAPLLVVERMGRDQGYFVAAGIVSYGNRQCDASLSSGVYTRVSFYLPWIQAVLSASSKSATRKDKIS